MQIKLISTLSLVCKWENSEDDQDKEYVRAFPETRKTVRNNEVSAGVCNSELDCTAF